MDQQRDDDRTNEDAASAQIGTHCGTSNRSCGSQTGLLLPTDVGERSGLYNHLRRHGDNTLSVGLAWIRRLTDHPPKGEFADALAKDRL
jgi:hypothetical protein